MTIEETIVDLLIGPLWEYFIVFLRVAALVSLLPAFGEQTISPRVKIGIAVAFTIFATPFVSFPSRSVSFDHLVVFCITEVVAGLALGLGLRLFILALQTAGAIAAQSTSLSQVLGGASVEPLPAMGYVLMLGGMALAVISGLHFKVVEFVQLSYEFIPLGLFVSASDLSSWGVAQVSRAFSLAFTLAAPFVILSVLYNFALGVINKAMPQLMVAFVGAPVITLGGLFVLMLSAPAILSVWLDAMDRFLQNPTLVGP
jgi:flagellar biosynthetic protein FliR